jgi:hypothetical protein
MRQCAAVAKKRHHGPSELGTAKVGNDTAEPWPRDRTLRITGSFRAFSKAVADGRMASILWCTACRSFCPASRRPIDGLPLAVHLGFLDAEIGLESELRGKRAVCQGWSAPTPRDLSQSTRQALRLLNASRCCPKVLPTPRATANPIHCAAHQPPRDRQADSQGTSDVAEERGTDDNS